MTPDANRVVFLLGGFPEELAERVREQVVCEIRAARAEALEEAARVAELVGGFSISPLTPYGECINETATRIAVAIRGMK